MISIDGSDRVVAAVREGRSDIGFTFYAPPDPELAMAFKVQAPLIAAMSAQHPLAGKSKVSLAECAAYPIAAPMQNTGSRIVIDMACKASGVHLKPTLESNSIPLGERVANTSTIDAVTHVSRHFAVGGRRISARRSRRVADAQPFGSSMIAGDRPPDFHKASCVLYRKSDDRPSAISRSKTGIEPCKRAPKDL